MRTNEGPTDGMDTRFDGCIAGLGTAMGLRAVVGHWPCSPFGAFTDIMVERSDGHRVLLAPTREVADFVAGTYRFDEVRVVPVTVSVDPGRTTRRAEVHHLRGRWAVVAGPLVVEFEVGRRPALGWLLRGVPRSLATATWWIAAIDGVARHVLPGVRTRGSAGGGRQGYYAALDLHRITAATVSWQGADQGPLAAVEPPVRFGFGSTPRAPSLVRIVTVVAAR